MLLVVAGFALYVPGAAFAQDKTSDFSGGYSFMKGGFDGENLHGFAGSVAAYHEGLHWLGIAFEGGANLGKNPQPLRSDLDLVHFSVGPRFLFSGSEKVTPFAQVLWTAFTGAGGENWQPEEFFMIGTELGVGADFWRSPRVGIRIDADYFVSHAGSRYNKTRLQVGFVFRRTS